MAVPCPESLCCGDLIDLIQLQANAAGDDFMLPVCGNSWVRNRASEWLWVGVEHQIRIEQLGYRKNSFAFVASDPRGRETVDNSVSSTNTSHEDESRKAA